MHAVNLHARELVLPVQDQRSRVVFATVRQDFEVCQEFIPMPLLPRVASLVIGNDQYSLRENLSDCVCVLHANLRFEESSIDHRELKP
jgi:hypothetical protein